MMRSVDSGQILGGRYRVLQVLERSRFGSLYLAEDTGQDGAQRAIAEFVPRLQGSGTWERAIELFEQEAALIRPLEHPQLPTFRELFCGDDGDRLFWVQDYIPSQSLRTLINARWVQGRSFSERECVHLLQRLLPVLDYLHSRGLIHRNLSPDSILLRQADRLPLLADLGSVKQVVLTLESEGADPHQPSPAQVGAPGYAPPEQLERGLVYTYSDLYALAMVVLVMLTGEEPLHQRDPQALILASQASGDLLAVLAKALAARPSDRYQSASEFLAALQALRLSESPGPPPPLPSRTPDAPPRLPRRPWLVLGLAFQGLLTVGFIVGAGALGWLVGRFWLVQQLPSPEVIQVPALELSPQVAPPELATAPEGLSFPPADDPEPEPSPELPEAERLRRLELRDRRRELAIDYSIYRPLVNQLYWSRYPDRREQLPGKTPAEAGRRAEYDEVASQLLTRLGQLSLVARSGLGRYREAERERWQQEAVALNVPPPAFKALVTAAFHQTLPLASETLGADWLEQPLGQLWSAIALDTLRQLESGEARTSLVLPAGQNTLQQEGTLAPGAGHLFVALLGENQWLALTALTTAQPLQLVVYGPDGKPLNADPEQRTWSGQLSQAGHYVIALISKSAQPLEYQFNFTVRNP